jgi:NhaP-type Na+/H+ or K+/H+ antiporter
MDSALMIVSVGLLVFLAHLFAALFSRTRVPDVLPLVLLGVLVGPVLKLVSAETFGQFGNIFTTIALVMILFESGLGLHFTQVHSSLLTGLRLTLVSYLLAVVSVWLIAIPLLELSVLEALILGAILGATAPAIVIPLSRQLRIEESTRTILLLETSISEALCFVVTLGFLQIVRYEELEPGLLVGQLISSFLLAAAIGVFFAFLWSSILNRIRQLSNSMFLTPAFVFILFGLTEILGYSGALASLAFGIVLGNAHHLNFTLLHEKTSLRPVQLKETEKAFFAEAVFLLKTFFFFYIGLSIRLHDVVLVSSGLILSFVLYAVRIPAVRLVFDRTVKKFDAAIMSIMIPKGMAAAVLANLPLLLKLSNGAIIQEVVFAVILISIFATSILSFFVERGITLQPYEFAFAKFSESAVEE